jgi:large subunit ribosomal protein L22
MPGPKTNEREGTRAVLRYAGLSPYKVREVLDVIRGRPVREAADVLRFVERDAAIVVEKLLQSAVANASNNDDQDADELYVSACYADEGPTAKRWRPRARGRAARIRKRSCHVTVIVSRLPEEKLARLQARRHAENLALRARRVEATRRARAQGAEGANRRERRHPAPVPEAPAEEAGAAGEALAEGEPGTGGPGEALAQDETGDEETGDEETGEDAGAGAAEALEDGSPAGAVDQGAQAEAEEPGEGGADEEKGS